MIDRLKLVRPFTAGSSVQKAASIRNRYLANKTQADFDRATAKSEAFDRAMEASHEESFWEEPCAA